MSARDSNRGKKSKDRAGIFFFAISCISAAILAFVVVELILVAMFGTLK